MVAEKGHGDAGCADGPLDGSGQTQLVDIISARGVDLSSQRERETRRLLDAMRVGVMLVDASGEVLLVNRAFLGMLGRTEPEALGRRIQELNWLVVDEDGTPLSGTERPISRALLTGEPVLNQTVGVRRPDEDEEVWMLEDAVPRLDEGGRVQQVVATFSDITERKRAEARSIENERRYRSLIETSADGILMTDASGNVVLANQRAAELYGFDSPEDLAACKAADLVAPSDLEHLQEALRTTRDTGVTRDVEYVRRCKDGSTAPTELSASVIRDDRGNPTMLTSFIRDISERKEHLQELNRLAHYDSLTKLPNRTLFTERLQQSLHAAHRAGSTLAVLLIGLNRFKEVNDTLGHGMGDLLLRQVAARIGDVVQEAGAVARLGGDEFVVLLRGANAVDPEVTADALANSLTEPFVLSGYSVYVGVSIGSATYPQHGDDPVTLLRRADVAMYEAKRTGSIFAMYNVEMDPNNMERLTLMGGLRRAIEEDQLVLHYQPKVHIASNEVRGVEALVRWDHPERGLVQPADFIPLAEQTGLIKPLTIWVLDQALKQVREWSDTDLDLAVAINLSAWNLHDRTLVDVVRALLEKWDVAPNRLQIEITETAIMVDPAGAMTTVNRLRDLGVRIAIDDFGTGYSSLTYLQRLPVDEVKVDRSFVLGMGRQEAEAGAIVRSVIDLGHDLQMQVVAEGVESSALLEQLALLHCDLAQGYHLCKPLSVVDLEAWVDQRRLMQRQAKRIVVVEDDPGVLRMLCDVLEMEGFSTVALDAPEQVEDLSTEPPPHLFMIDAMLLGTSGIELAAQLRTGRFSSVPMVAMSASDLLVETAEESGLFDATLKKPMDIKDIVGTAAQLTQ